MQSIIKCVVLSSTALLLMGSGLCISIYLRSIYPPADLDFDFHLSSPPPPPPPPLTTFGRIRNFSLPFSSPMVSSMLGRRQSSSSTSPAAAFLTPVISSLPTSQAGQASTDVEICYNDKGNMVKHGEQYIPLGIDTCTQCTCMHGKAEMCISVLCSPPDKCRKYHEVTNKCCEFLCLDGEMSNGLRFFNKTIFAKSGPDTRGFNPMASNNLGLRLIASTITSFIILAMLLFLIHRLRQRRLLLMLRRLNTRRMVERAPGDHRARTLDQNALRFGYFGRQGARGDSTQSSFPNFGPYLEPPPPYSFWKPPEHFIGPGEAPPPYEETVNNSPQSQQSTAEHFGPLNTLGRAQQQQQQPYFLTGNDFASQPEALPSRLITLQSIMMNSIGLHHQGDARFLSPSSRPTEMMFNQSPPPSSSQPQQTCLKSNVHRSSSLNHGSKYVNRHASLPQVLPHHAPGGSASYHPQHLVTHLVNGDTPQSYISHRPLSADGRSPAIIDTVISNPSYEHITVLRIGANTPSPGNGQARPSSSTPAPPLPASSSSSSSNAKLRLLAIGLHNKAIMQSAAPSQAKSKQHRASFGGATETGSPSLSPPQLSIDRLDSNVMPNTGQPSSCSSISVSLASASSSSLSSSSSASSQSTVVHRNDSQVCENATSSMPAILPIGQPKTSGVTFATISRL